MLLADVVQAAIDDVSHRSAAFWTWDEFELDEEGVIKTAPDPVDGLREVGTELVVRVGSRTVNVRNVVVRDAGRIVELELIEPPGWAACSGGGR